MSSHRAHRTRHFLGFGVSVLLHLGLLLAVLGWLRTPGEAMKEGGGHPVPVSLTMFESAAPQETAERVQAEEAPKEVEPLAEPVLEAPPDAVQDSEPEPVEPSEPAPEPSAEQQPQPEARPELKPKPDPKPKPKSTPKPRPKPAPKSTPTPKPQAKPKPPTVATTQPPAATRPEAKAAAADRVGDKGESGAVPSAPEKASAAALERRYLEGLRRAIESHKFYPKRARRRGDEGQALVAFVVQADGRITDVEIRRSSGSKRLDKAAAEALERLARYQPIPEALGRQRWPLRVPINFTLD